MAGSNEFIPTVKQSVLKFTTLIVVDCFRICGNCVNALFERYIYYTFLVIGILLKTGSDQLKYICRVLIFPSRSCDIIDNIMLEK